MAEEPVGRITHFYGNVGVGVLKLSAPLKVGDTIHVRGKEVDFTQAVKSMQVEHKNISAAKPKQEIGLKVEQPVKEGCEVFKVTD